MDPAPALEALADPTRRRALEILRGGALAVAEIAEQMPVSRPAVSQHLKVLEDAGLVRHRKEGTRHLYSIHPDGVQEARAYLDRMWTDALSHYEEFARQQHPPKRGGSAKRS